MGFGHLHIFVWILFLAFRRIHLYSWSNQNYINYK
jgi:hypothetical protein